MIRHINYDLSVHKTTVLTSVKKFNGKLFFLKQSHTQRFLFAIYSTKLVVFSYLKKTFIHMKGLSILEQSSYYKIRKKRKML